MRDSVFDRPLRRDETAHLPGRQSVPSGNSGRGEQALDLVAAEHRLEPPRWSRALVRFELIDRIDRDPAVPAGVADDPVQRCERAGGGLRRASLGAERAHQCGDVIDRQRAHSPGREGREQVTLEVVPVGLERAGMPLVGADPGQP